jgi:hypothetical protein
MAARLVCCLHIVDIPASAGKEAEILLSLRTGCPKQLARSLLRPRLSQTKQPALAATAARTGSGKTVTEATPDTMAEATPETTPEATAKTAGEAVAKATVKMMESLHDDDRRREAE